MAQSGVGRGLFWIRTCANPQYPWAKAQEIGVDFKGNTDLETAVKTNLGVADAADSTSTDASASPEATADAASTAEATAGTN